MESQAEDLLAAARYKIAIGHLVPRSLDRVVARRRKEPGHSSQQARLKLEIEVAELRHTSLPKLSNLQIPPLSSLGHSHILTDGYIWNTLSPWIYPQLLPNASEQERFYPS